MAVTNHRLDKMMNPKTVVVIGDKGPGYMWIRNNLPFKEQGGNLYSLQIDEKEIPGIDHGFSAAEDAEESYLSGQMGGEMNPVIVETVVDWVKKQVAESDA